MFTVISFLVFAFLRATTLCSFATVFMRSLDWVHTHFCYWDSVFSIHGEARDWKVIGEEFSTSRVPRRRAFTDELSP